MAVTSSQPSITTPQLQPSPVHCYRWRRILIVPPHVMEFLCPGCQWQHQMIPPRNPSGAPLPVCGSHRVGSIGSQVLDDRMSCTMAETDADSKPLKKEFYPKTSIFSLKDKTRLREIEVVEDCFILEFDPYEFVAAFPTFSKLVCGHDFAILEEGEVACRDYPHSRHLCATYPFQNTPHDFHCQMCYCYVCDMPAPCEQWTEQSTFFKHCEASPDIQIWTDLRNARKRNFHMLFDEIFTQDGYETNYETNYGIYTEYTNCE